MSEEYEIPEDLYYTEEHEWLKVLEDGTALVGITDYAQKSLHEVVYVELPNPGDMVKQGEAFGTVESVKAVSDLYSPVSGIVEEVNEELLDSPELINSDPYGKGWIVKIKPKSLEDELENLLNAEQYREHLGSLEAK
ncbi:glycine cleavage system protein GcvH [Candidatus Bathyarchaeota archaeon]|nr:glycine cleavage system protein GcvH [Candidatus Bathyarchaeota archaeon]RJS89463.1 MAG: glycine cleavage system protein GcvH [Candidatus Bathyarchaeota archaeon]RLI33257.1 MAG: glycine cleavage system protein GcvH [Candidatus Bathyarchaeota archaeon]